MKTVPESGQKLRPMNGILRRDGRAVATIFRLTAINTIEMWQAESFDPATIDKELGWAEELGF